MSSDGSFAEAFPAIISSLNVVLDVSSPCGLSIPEGLRSHLAALRDCLVQSRDTPRNLLASDAQIFELMNVFEHPSQFFTLAQEDSYFLWLLEAMRAAPSMRTGTLGSFVLFSSQLHQVQEAIVRDDPPAPLPALSEAFGVILGFVYAHGNLLSKWNFFQKVDGYLGTVHNFLFEWEGYLEILRIISRLNCLLAELYLTQMIS
jgi:hypothetical protein